MNDYKMVKRLQTLLMVIQSPANLTKKDLCNRLYYTHGIKVSQRTLERDLKNLRENFNIHIRYSRMLEAYELSGESLPRINDFLKFARIVEMGSFINTKMQNPDALEDYADLFDHEQFKGFDLVEPILLAIQGKKDLSFVHENYYEGTFTPYQITPLKIKEYLNRWYVMGVTKEKREFRLFGLDRISELKTEPGSKIKKAHYAAQIEGYNKIIGLTYEHPMKPEKIVLRVHHKQIKYLRALPLHPSQHIDLKEGAEYGIVTYHLIPNYELKQELLKLNFMVEVIQPLHLRQEMKSLLEKTLKHYQ